ncbi:MAG: dipeptide ABC transporter ATP-binding protein [Thermodesulfobacteriota bacterium]|nr:dipeptide ABC transporter ATP-binding protein [Thermodesulfobacteriota bacterium]
MDDDILTLNGLRKYYFIKEGFFSLKQSVVKAVDGVNLSIKRGETLGLVGESGCGKSTLGRLILKLEEPTAGTICFDREDITACSKKELQRLRRQMQIIFQDPYSSLNPRKTIGKIIEEPFVIHGIGDRRQRKEKVKKLLDLVGLRPEYTDRYPHEFSGGQRQRIGIARAISLHPKLIIADEPVSALDVSIQAQVLNLLYELQEEFHLTYLFIAHDLSVVKFVSDRVAVMYLGRIVELAQSNAIYNNSLHPYTEALLLAVPVPDPAIKKERILLEGDPPNPIDPPDGCFFHTRCKYKMNICEKEYPPIKEVERGHFVACHMRN